MPALRKLLIISFIALLTGCTNNFCCTQPSSSLSACLNAQGIQVIQIGQKVRIILPTDHCFDPGTANLLDSCTPKLENLVALLKTYRCVPMTVTGYTDDVINPLQAQQLSRYQADSIIAFCFAHGLPFRQMRAVGKGYYCTVADNRTVNGSAWNRRIEITFMQSG